MKFSLATVPDALPKLPCGQEEAEKRWQAFHGTLAAQENKLPAEILNAFAGLEENRLLLQAMLCHSPYLSYLMTHEPAALAACCLDGADATLQATFDRMGGEALQAEKTQDFMRLLRQAKRQCALVTALADLSGAWPLEKVTTALSTFADMAVELTLLHWARLEKEKGELAAPDGLAVIGMGKLGACELNYSSDIDVMVLFERAKSRYTGKRDAQECFVRFAQALTRILQERTADGYVFRTDLRLRPDPAHYPAAVSMEAALVYYETLGQNWERAAMIKARPIAGDRNTGEYFLQALRPYMWRKSLDFASIQDIHSIKRQIDASERRKALTLPGFNVKLGHGGIREIEFFVQTQQLIWGGRRKELRVRGTCEGLATMASLNMIRQDTARALTEAYRFLRMVEHRLQMVNDQQTHSLPESQEERQRIAAFCGFGSLESFDRTLAETLETVRVHYEHLFEESQNLSDQSGGGSLVFTGVENDPETLKTIENMGYKNPGTVADAIRAWHHGRRRSTRTKRARELLTELVPLILKELAATANPDQAFLKFDEFLTRLPAVVQLFSLFSANPKLLTLLAEIMGGAPHLAELLSRKPSLLDVVLTQGFYDPAMGSESLAAELHGMVEHKADFEEILDITRRFKHEKEFQLGIQLLGGKTDIEQIGVALSDVAETVLAYLLQAVQREFSSVYGTIPGGNLAVIALGKLGGRELTFGSDLDLVFVYDAPEDAVSEGGEKSYNPNVYYARLVQRFTGALTALTGEGYLYELDLRLRPHGAKGPMASDIGAFDKYFDESAWVFEYMALTRARVIAGPEALARKLEAIFRRHLLKPRNTAELTARIDDMREKTARGHPTTDIWKVKHIRGGLVDLEFIAQYVQLREAHAHPEIIAGSTQQAFDRIAALGVLPPALAAELCQHARFIRRLQTLLRLTCGEKFDEATAPEGLKKLLARLCNKDDFAALKAELLETETRVLTIYNSLIRSTTP